MCLILTAHQTCSDYKFVLLANQSLTAQCWPDNKQILGGKDCDAGGSWLCVDRSGRLAAITNIRQPPFDRPYKFSRGQIVNDFLTQHLSAEDFLKNLALHDQDYRLFNLLIMDHSGLWHYSSESHQYQRVPSGVNGLSNATLNTPWPKLSKSRLKLQTSLERTPNDRNSLLDIMTNREKPPVNTLPNTGIGLALEEFLSPIFIVGENYGTRCSTLITISQTDELVFDELTYTPLGEKTKQVSHRIILSK